jgi:hypothetical protein
LGFEVCRTILLSQNSKQQEAKRPPRSKNLNPTMMIKLSNTAPMALVLIGTFNSASARLSGRQLQYKPYGDPATLTILPTTKSVKATTVIPTRTSATKLAK